MLLVKLRTLTQLNVQCAKFNLTFSICQFSLLFLLLLASPPLISFLNLSPHHFLTLIVSSFFCSSSNCFSYHPSTTHFILFALLFISYHVFSSWLPLFVDLLFLSFYVPFLYPLLFCVFSPLLYFPHLSSTCLFFIVPHPVL